MTENVAISRAPEVALPAPLDRIEAAWSRWLAALARVPADRMAQPLDADGWSARDLAGHVAFWDDFAITHATDLLEGRSYRETDWQALNDADVAANANQSAEAQLRRMHAAHAALLRFLAGLDYADVDPAALHERVKGCADEHYDEHTATLEAWLAANG